MNELPRIQGLNTRIWTLVRTVFSPLRYVESKEPVSPVEGGLRRSTKNGTRNVLNPFSTKNYIVEMCVYSVREFWTGILNKYVKELTSILEGEGQV